MAGQTRRSSTSLEAQLVDVPKSFDFFQAVRLLRLLSSRKNTRENSIRMRPQLSLAFPQADVSSIQPVKKKQADYQMDLTFLGLYGPSSPLPTFYTEDLLDEQSEEESVTRDFLDIFNQRIYELFFSCWSKYHHLMRITEENDDEAKERLYCLLGLGEQEVRETLPDSFQLLRYIGLFPQFPRSALSLQTLLRDVLNILPVDIEPCIPKWVQIPMDQRSKLGQAPCQLGQNLFVGSQIQDRMTTFTIHIGPLKKRSFQKLMPGMPQHELLVRIVRLYVSDALDYDLNLTLKPGEAERTCLGGAQWSTLGLDTWIFSEQQLGGVEVTFQPESIHR